MDFTAMLDTHSNDVQKPKVQPQGTYAWTVTKYALSSVSSAKGDWDVVEFKVRAVRAEDDVDPDQLEEFGDLKIAMNRVSFMFSKASDAENERVITQNKLDKFLVETLGNEPAPMREMLASAVNCQFLGRAVWRVVDDATYIDIKDMMPLD